MTALVYGAEDPVTFKTDVSLTRVDARVTDGQGRIITGLGLQDFVLTLKGKPLALKNVASEDVPIDILLLLDVSGSMQPHVRRIATAARQALNVLAEQDRVAVMIFDTRTKLRLPFRNNHGEVVKELDRILDSEHFAGGTRITSSLLDAARYMSREARPDARRAIVILTDDQTQDEEDESLVERMLARGNTVLSFLQAPYEDPMRGMGGGGGPRSGGGGPMGGGRRGGTWGSSGGGWPSSGGGLGWPGGRGQGGGGNYPVNIGNQSHTAGTAIIAEDTGGDTFRVTEASALEDTLARLRQSYALYCYLPAGETLDNGQVIRVDLSQETQILHSTAVVQSRRVFMSDTAPAAMGPTTITHADPDAAAMSTGAGTTTAATTSATPTTTQQRRGQRRAVNEDSGEKVNTVTPPPDR